jgi:NADH:ubiquinone oxidoreductase subunit E
MGKDLNKCSKFIFVCHGSDCKSHSKELTCSFKEELKRRGLKEDVMIIKTKCTGRCKEGPVVIVDNQWHLKVKEKQVKEILDQAFHEIKKPL